MADPEQRLLCKIVYRSCLDEALQAQITSAYFHDPYYFELWKYLEEHWTKYGTTLNRSDVAEIFTDFVFVKVPEPLDYYLDALRAHHRRACTFDVVTDATTHLKSEDPDGALSVMSDGVMRIEQQTAATVDEDVISTWEGRMARWQDIEDNAGVLAGIPTGFDFIDRATGGLRPEQFTVLIGPAKSGKSSIALSMAVAANNAGYSGVFIGFEMSNEEQNARHDAIHGGFNPNQLLHGRATVDEKQRLRQALARIQNNPPLHFIHDMGARTLGSTIAKIHQYRPQFVIVDGVYMMDAEIPGVESMDTKALTKISRSLKVCAQTLKVPIIVTTQVPDWKWNPKSGLTAGSTGYTSAFSQDCDVMLGIEPANEDRIATLRLIIGRHAGPRAAYISFDWDRGAIEERESWEGDDSEDDEAMYG